LHFSALKQVFKWCFSAQSCCSAAWKACFLGLLGQFLNVKHGSIHLMFAEEHKLWTIDDWQTAFLNNEYSFEIGKKSPGDDSWHLVSSAIVYFGPRTLQEVFNMLTLKSMKTCWYMSQQMGKLCAYLLELNQNTISTQLHQKRKSTATHSELNLHTSFSGISYWLGLKYFLIFKLFQHEITN